MLLEEEEDVKEFLYCSFFIPLFVVYCIVTKDLGKKRICVEWHLHAANAMLQLYIKGCLITLQVC